LKIFITEIKYIMQANDSTQTHNVLRCNALNAKRNNLSTLFTPNKKSKIVKTAREQPIVTIQFMSMRQNKLKEVTFYIHVCKRFYIFS